MGAGIHRDMRAGAGRARDEKFLWELLSFDSMRVKVTGAEEKVSLSNYIVYLKTSIGFKMNH